MKKYVRLGIFFALMVFCIISLMFFYSCRELYEWNSSELTLSRSIAIISINIFFLTLMFLIDSKIYKLLFKSVIIFSIGLWGFVHSLQFFETEQLLVGFWNFIDTIFYIAWSFLAPGLIFYIIHYIHKSTEKFEEAKIGEYHIHESFAGLILFVLAFFLWILLVFLTQFEILLKELSFIIAILRIFLFLFIYCGSFLVFRDKDDLFHLKFLEKKEKREKSNNNSSVFLNLTEEDIHFFKTPILILFPLGMILTSFTIDILVYGTSFLPIDSSAINLLGYICCFLSGGLIGLDWFRIFKVFYPELYNEISVVLDNLKKQEE